MIICKEKQNNYKHYWKLIKRKDQIIYNCNYKIIRNTHELIYFGKIDLSDINDTMININWRYSQVEY